MLIARPWWLLLALSASPLAAQSPAHEHVGARQPSSFACAPGTWERPRVLRGAPAGSLIRRPTLAVGSRGVFVVGQDWPHNDGAPLPANPLIALNGRGNIGKPPGRFTFFSPKAVIDQTGVLHVLWAEPSSPDSVRRTLGRDLRSVWYAAFARGKWSVPERVYATTGVLKWEPDTGIPVFDRSGTLHAAVVVWSEEDGVVHLWRRNGRWTAARVPGTARPLYGTLTAAPDSGVYLAFIAPDATREHDSGSVFLTHLRAEGRAWTPPILVSRSGRTQATSVRALFTPDGSLHLIWGQNLTGGLIAEVVRHVASRDGGLTWSAPQDLPTEPFFRSDLRVASDACGVVHVIYDDLHEALSSAEPGSERGELRHAWWDGAWHGPDSPWSGLNIIESDLAPAPDGRVHVFAVARPVSDHSLTVNFVPMVISSGAAAPASRPSSRKRGRHER